MEAIHSLAYGFSVCLQPINLFYCFLGVLMGTLVGVLPGLGPAAAISLLLPTVFHAPGVSSLIMLAGITYGAQYGGSTTSILLNIPGEASSVVTCMDGYQMARHGRAGPALGMAAFGSFIAGTVSVVGLMLFAPTLAAAALRFGPPEYFSLAVMALTLVTYLTKGSVGRSITMASVGIIFSMVGLDPITSGSRFTFGLRPLTDGLDIILVAMGLFGMSEVFENIGSGAERGSVLSTRTKFTDLLPNRTDWRHSAKPIGRGTVIGFFLGMIPGTGNAIPTFISYALEKRLSKHPERFGTGMIEGVAGPEATNNAACSGHFIPLLSLGVPANPSTAILLGALMIMGFRPGPLLIQSNPELFWGLVASMYAGNVMLLVLNLPLIGLWVRMLKIPYSILSVLIILFCEIGAYSVNSSVTDVLIMNLFGLIGYAMKRYDFSGAPLILAFILGPMLERSLRQSLILSHGSPVIFFSRPISLVFICLAIALATSTVLWGRRLSEDAIEMKDG
jgi:putative tricarboxylic transport membrane protein